ncbi:M23 family metallopeptidase [Roseospira goensis]|uniref:Murein DD-endopeptidase MepM/ murein hydrolase activator NlpD n=1 Tax=Roseospira goensis TaxID=391922 RepID=A0A7W6S0H1_9PROT|nr:peptidoglycan DD-metalloendopeptidase family protein [Roseospira goensis]MBB4286014.1 murein DD-endopeptidase MepM/ murein hydrolase activator NlpD [Roseospira goensis]
MRSPLIDRTQDLGARRGAMPTRRRAARCFQSTGLVAGLAIGLVASLVVTGPAGAGSDRMAAAAAADVALVAALEGAPIPGRKPGSATDQAKGDQATAEAAAGRAQAAAVDPAARPVPPVGGPARPPAATATATATADVAMQAAASPPVVAPIAVEARVDRGDTLIGLLIEAGVERVEAHKAIKALEAVYDPRRMRPGHVVNIRFDEPETDTLAFRGFDFEPTTGTQVAVLPDDGAEFGFSAQETQEQLVRDVVRFGGPITLSLYQAAVDAGVSEQALAEMIRVLSYDVDFQRDIQKDDAFEVLYERFSTRDGRHVRDGRILFTALTNAGKRLTAYAYETEDGRIDYFDENGEGVRKPLMRTPIDGARLSSSFGMRKHPILGYSKMHTGVDFAAPTGTPIYAAGDGVVRYAGRKGGYGKYVQIRHTGEFSTAYAHMSAILVRNGQRVEQGEVIGRVGSTGRSTGPHLHYEILRNGDKVNPMGVRFQPAVKLAGADLKRFQAHRAEVDRLYASLRAPTEIASAARTQTPE